MSSPRNGPHRQLIVWQKSMLLAAEVYDVVRNLPAQERFELGSQMRRAAVSIPSCIAEGKGRRTQADYARFLAAARGSAFELDTTLEVAELCRLIDAPKMKEAQKLVDEVCRMLTAMLRKFRPL